MDPVLDMRHRPAPEPAFGADWQQTKQLRTTRFASPEQKQFQIRMMVECTNAGLQKPVFVENIGLARLPGQLLPCLDEIGIDPGCRMKYRRSFGWRQAVAEPAGANIRTIHLL